MNAEDTLLAGYVGKLCDQLRGEYEIEPKYLMGENLKRGLRNADGTGVLAGVTRIGSVQGYIITDGERQPIPGKLFYRGIDVMDIVEDHSRTGEFGYEEVAYLLLFGRLPTKEQFQLFNTVLCKERQLPPGFFEDMILKAPSRNIMNKLARGVLALYSYDPDPDNTAIENMIYQSIQLIARFPSIVANAYAVKRHHYEGKSLYIHNPKENLSVAENFLRMLRSDKSYSDEEAKLLDMLLILHAEHGGGNNSTFACRSLASSGTDTYSAIAAGVGSLKGPLHGGANSKVMEMFRYVKENVGSDRSDDNVGAYLDKLLDGTAGDRSGKIYGLGHAVYTVSDPRADLIKKYARQLAEDKGMGEDLLLLEQVERLGVARIMDRKKMEIPISANVDLYSGLVYSMLGIPEELYTPLFAIARISGWCAHRIEEQVSGGRIVRPGYRSAVKQAEYVPMEERV